MKMETKLPHTKNEAFAQLDAMLSEEDRNAIMNGNPFEFYFSPGCGFGTTGSMSRMKRM